MIRSTNQTMAANAKIKAPEYKVYEVEEIDQRLTEIVRHSHEVVEYRIDTLRVSVDNNAEAIKNTQKRVQDLEDEAVKKPSIRVSDNGRKQVVTDLKVIGVKDDKATIQIQSSDVGKGQKATDDSPRIPGTDGSPTPQPQEALVISGTNGITIKSSGAKEVEVSAELLVSAIESRILEEKDRDTQIPQQPTDLRKIVLATEA